MNTKIFNEKPKFFVSYPPGSGGQFMCLLIIALQTPVELIDPKSGHAQIDLINAGRDPGFQFSKRFLKHTAEDMDLETGSAWLRKNFKFYDIDRNYYTIHCHLKNLSVIIKAWPDAKIINIYPEKTDFDQMWYNFVTKSMEYHNEWYMLIPRILKIRENYNRLHWIDIDNIDNYRHNIRLCCYIMKFSRLRTWPEKENTIPRCYWVKFQDVFNKNLVNQLDQLIEFLDIKVTDEKKEFAIQMINEYTDAQTIIPWQLSLEDYQ